MPGTAWDSASSVGAYRRSQTVPDIRPHPDQLHVGSSGEARDPAATEPGSQYAPSRRTTALTVRNTIATSRRSDQLST